MSKLARLFPDIRARAITMQGIRSVRTSVWIFSGLLLILGLTFIYFLSQATRVYYEVEVETGFSIEARKNPFLALTLFLQQQNVSVELKKDFSYLDNTIHPNDTVIITNSRRLLSTQRLNRLREFVKAGGHLILNATDTFNDERNSSGGPFLDELGCRLYYDQTNDKDDGEESISEFSFEGFEQTTRVDFNPYYYLLDASGQSTFSSSDDKLDHMLQYSYGNGLITIISDIKFLYNHSIEDEDHAMFIWQLTQGARKIWLFYDSQMPTLMTLLWQQASSFVISLMLLIALVFWYQQIKTGPVFPQFNLSRRELLQHISAAAQFKWQYNNKTPLLQPVREDIYHLLRRRINKFDQQASKEQIHWLNQQTQIPHKQIAQAMFDAPENEEQLKSQIQTLQIIRKLL